MFHWWGKEAKGAGCEGHRKHCIYKFFLASFLLLNHSFLFGWLSWVVFSAPVWGDSVGISWRCLTLVKLDRLGYRMVKNCDNTLSRFHTIPERNGRTDRQTNRQICNINIARQYARYKPDSFTNTGANRCRLVINVLKQIQSSRLAHYQFMVCAM